MSHTDTVGIVHAENISGVHDLYLVAPTATPNAVDTVIQVPVEGVSAHTPPSPKRR